MLAAGKWDVFEETFRKNLKVMKEAGSIRSIASCPACNMMWRQVYPAWAKKLGIEYGITARHYSEVLAEKIRGRRAFVPLQGETEIRHRSPGMTRVTSAAPQEFTSLLEK